MRRAQENRPGGNKVPGILRATAAGCVSAALLAACLACLSGAARAADTTPQLVLRMRSQTTGTLSNGVILGEGYLVYHGEHTGFQVWSDVEKTTDQPQRYAMAGKNGRRNKVRIRLGGEGWQQDDESGKGIFLLTGDDVVKFTLYGDGDQAVIPDEYPVQIHGVVLLP